VRPGVNTTWLASMLPGVLPCSPHDQQRHCATRSQRYLTGIEATWCIAVLVCWQNITTWPASLLCDQESTLLDWHQCYLVYSRASVLRKYHHMAGLKISTISLTASRKLLTRDNWKLVWESWGHFRCKPERRIFGPSDHIWPFWSYWAVIELCDLRNWMA